MPRIFDNIDQSLLPALRQTLELSLRSDFCVGYFNLRGWKQIDQFIEQWAGGEGQCCRLLVGMNRPPQEELRSAISVQKEVEIDNATAIRWKKQLAEEFRHQLVFGAPTNADEAGLRRLAAQLRAKKVIVKLHLRYPLHAKLYLLFRNDPNNPTTGFVGSSNLTFAGLAKQGELNVDVLEHDACDKLAKWFNDRWGDRWCIDISKELADIIDESWAGDRARLPYHIYIKMAWHLSHEARKGLAEFRIPPEFGDKLFAFQTAAIKMAARHLNKRGGVLIGDVVGLGKTLMATAVARIIEIDHGHSTLILCPKNLKSMWRGYAEEYGLHAKIVSFSMAAKELSQVPARFRLVLIDESHNLRNREGKRYAAIREYIRQSNSKVILLSATPYNKNYLDLSNQLRLFLEPDKELSVRPERLLREMGEIEFGRLQIPPKSLLAFEHSTFPDDWRELMRLYMVRRTRSFIQDNYAETDPANGRKFLRFSDGTPTYFPTRVPKTVKFKIDDDDPTDQYALLYSDASVARINRLALPRYGLGNYVDERPDDPPTAAEARVIADLSRAGKRLMGFCRTNLFKRLESSGMAFLQSIERHLLRNYVYLHAIEKGLPLPIGAQDAHLLDARFQDDDAELFDEQAEDEDDESAEAVTERIGTQGDLKRRAATVYAQYIGPYKTRFRWIDSRRFVPQLARDLASDCDSLVSLLQECGDWNADRDAKLKTLAKLLATKHAGEKVIIFTQFADTVHYLHRQLAPRLDQVASVTGGTEDPSKIVDRFSPESNRKRQSIAPENEVQVLLATDILSEGQNLQDAHIIINYDLPWAIIRLIQRAGRVDRIGQKADKILCYSFLPADGVERIIRLRSRVRQRLQENAEVVGSDESFFEDDRNDSAVRDLFTEKAGILDGEDDREVDLESYAYQIWKNATESDPSLKATIENMPDVVYSTKTHQATDAQPGGVLAYVRTSEDHDALAWFDHSGRLVTESPFAVLNAAACQPETPAVARLDEHHDLVRKAVAHVASEEKSVGGQLGRPSGARFRVYEQLKRFTEEVRGTLFDTTQLKRALDDIYAYPLKATAVEQLNRQLRSGVGDEDLAQAVVRLRQEGKLSVIHEEEESQEPQIICSLGLASENRGQA